MSKRPGIWTFVVLLLALSAAWGQDDAAQQPEYVPPVTNPQQPTLPSGMDNITPSISENPPISGVDLPSVGPHSAPLSYLQAGGHLSETVDSNIQNALGGSNTSTISVALGSLELQRLWSNYDLALDYLGGAGYYYGTGLGLLLDIHDHLPIRLVRYQPPTIWLSVSEEQYSHRFISSEVLLFRWYHNVAV